MYIPIRLNPKMLLPHSHELMICQPRANLPISKANPTLTVNQPTDGISHPTPLSGYNQNNINTPWPKLTDSIPGLSFSSFLGGITIKLVLETQSEG